MTTYITVDLASKQSAWAVSDSSGNLLDQGDSLHFSSKQTVEEIGRLVDLYNPAILLVEDVPYGISSQAMVKPVLRLQGMLMLQIYMLSDFTGEFYFINPASWQKFFEGVARGPAAERIEAARIHAKRLGYEPPDLVQPYIDSLPAGKRATKTALKPLQKTMTDYIDARLMAEYIRMHDGNIAGLSGVQAPSI
jgi:hypothetical protein